MNTQGARELVLKALPDGELKAADVVTVTNLTTGEFRPVFWVAGVNGNMAIYAGQDLDFEEKPATGVPFQVDWRLYHGVNGCLWDDEPIGAAPTIFPDGSPSSGTPKREGLLFQLDGTHARSYLVHGRVRGITSTVQVPISVHVLRSSFGPPLTISVGSFTG